MTSQGTNTPLDKSTMTISQNNQLKKDRMLLLL